MIQVLNKFRLGVNYDFTSKNIDNTDKNSSSNENTNTKRKKVLLSKYK